MAAAITKAIARRAAEDGRARAAELTEVTLTFVADHDQVRAILWRDLQDWAGLPRIAVSAPDSPGARDIRALMAAVVPALEPSLLRRGSRRC
ncbi:hypothetical protein ABZ864_45915 [Streptomyces sp. NPDC047082]|uniref:hypothetical protein n=1 Tax=Streptomyces sp. NPDC047082 TaxID=3155259 RepID=UPI0033F89C9E